MASAGDGQKLSKLGRYELLELLGRGGMAEVYKARLPGALGIDKMVAVKRILPEARNNTEYVEMFVSEARLCSRMMHPNLIQVFEFAETDGELFLAMELVEGSDLRKVITAHKQLGKEIPLEFVACAALGVLRGLDGAHRLLDEKGAPLNVVHRDLSPANVLVSYEGAIKVADFGVARTDSKADADANSVKGKLQYMAPEQLLTGQVDIRVDVFAAGCVLYELLCGQPVYAFGQTPEVIQAVAKGHYKPIEQVLPTIDKTLAAIVRKSLAADRDRRYSDCSAFANDLSRLIQMGRLPCATGEEFGLYLQVLLPKQPFRAELTFTPSREDQAVPILAGQVLSDVDVPLIVPQAAAKASTARPASRPPPPPPAPQEQSAPKGEFDLDFGGTSRVPDTGPLSRVAAPRPASTGLELDRGGYAPAAASRPPSGPLAQADAPAPSTAPGVGKRRDSGSLSELDRMLRAYIEEGDGGKTAPEPPKVEVKQEKKWFKWRK